MSRLLALLAFAGAGLAEAEACAADGCAVDDGTALLQTRLQAQAADAAGAGDVVRVTSSRRRRGGTHHAASSDSSAEHHAASSAEHHASSSAGHHSASSAEHHVASSAAPAPQAAADHGLVPTASELETLSAVVGRLWQLDAPYRLEPGTGYRLNMQNRAASLQSGKDTSSSGLFEFVDQRKLLSAPCASEFLALLDNYERDTSKAEKSTAQGHTEESSFAKCLMSTPHMKYVYNVLVQWKAVPADYAAFARQVSTIWFTVYGLSSHGPAASSGFEHTFVGEEKFDNKAKESTIIGLHNWLQFWREEAAGRINYLGFVGDRQADSIVSVRFAWQDADSDVETKSVSTFLVGSSPPFEMAMLTCAFLGFGGEAKVPGIYFGREGPVELVAYSWNSHGKTLVRTAYLQQ